MNYTAAFTDFYKSPKWMMNLLLGAVCAMIPVVGPLVYMGWLITGFWGREDQRPETFPDFDFNHFTKYLERGVWPFLMTLIVSLVMMIPMLIVVFGSMFLIVGTADHGQDHGGGMTPWMVLGTFTMFGGMIVMILGVHLIMVPLMLRASLTQDFKASFSFAWVKHFIRLMWLDIIVSMLVVMVVGMVFGTIGYLMICIGMFIVMPLIYHAWFGIQQQLYKVFLSRGGEPIPLSPKLREGTPPPMPPTLA